MKKKSIIIPIVLLVIGFAAVSTTLYLNGVVGIGTNENNYIDGVVFDEESLKSSEGTTAEISESGRTITFTTQEMKTVGEEAKVNFKIKNYSQYNAILGTPAISCYFVNDHQVDTKAESTSTTHEYMQLIPGEELNGTTINAGGGISAESSVTVKQIKSYVGDTQTIKFQCEINTSGIDSETPGIEKPLPTPSLLELPEGVTLTSDKDGNGVADIGDEITVGTESFYVISHTDSELNALAKYNLKVGNIYTSDWNLERTISSTEEGYGIQNANARGYVAGDTKYYGTVAFSNNNGWPYANNDTIDIKSYDGPVKEALYGANGYEKYIQKTIPSATVRLITFDEEQNLTDYSWLYSTSYWTQSATSDGDDRGVWFVESDGYFYVSDFGSGNNYGVRPVITISEV